LIIKVLRLANHRSPLTGKRSRIVAYTGLDGGDELVRAAIACGADAVAFKTGNFDHLESIVKGDHPGDVPIGDMK
jgi:hypothetical protein